MEFKLPADGVIKKLNKNRPSTIYLIKYDILVCFDPFTKIDGCKFNQLCEGDEIIVHNMDERTTTKGKFYMCKNIVLADVQKKWDNLLKNDNKYSIDHDLNSYDSFIPRETIQRSKHQVKKAKNPKNINSRDEKILFLYDQGKSFSFIAGKVGLSKSQVHRIVEAYRYK